MISETATEIGIDTVTLYCLSSENWKRPQQELDFLMHLLEQYLIEERRMIMEQGLRLQVIGRRDRLPESVLAEMERTIEMSADNQGTRLVLGDRLWRSRRDHQGGARSGEPRFATEPWRLDDINEQTVNERLYTAGLPEVDLMIRTGGDMRVSNFLALATELRRVMDHREVLARIHAAMTSSERFVDSVLGSEDLVD